jgi:hypothetical protein
VHVAGEQEGDLRLDPGMDEPGQVDRLPVRRQHSAGDEAVQRRVDVHHLLLRLAGQPELRADQSLAGFEPGLNSGPLRRIGGFEVKLRELVGERLPVPALPLGRRELSGDLT